MYKRQVPVDQPSQRLALVNARAVTMNPEREVIPQATVLIENDRIISVGAASDIEVPTSYQSIDLAGKTILPGLIDAHAHGPYGRDEIIPQANWSLLAHLALGVTTIHNPSSRANQVFAAAEYQKAGKILGPRIYSTGEIVYGCLLYTSDAADE